MVHILPIFDDALDVKFRHKYSPHKLLPFVTTSIGLLRIIAFEDYYEISEIIRIISVSFICLLAHLQKKTLTRSYLELLLNCLLTASQIICEVESMRVKVGKGNSNAGAYYMGLLLNTSTYLIINWRLAFLVNTFSIIYYCLRICKTPGESLEFISQSLFLLLLSAYFLYSQEEQSEINLKKITKSESNRKFLQEFIHNYVSNPIVICKSNQSGNFDIEYVNSATYELLKVNEFDPSKPDENLNMLEESKLLEKLKVQESLNAFRFKRVKENGFKFPSNSFIKKKPNPSFEEIFNEVSSSNDSNLIFKEFEALLGSANSLSKSFTEELTINEKLAMNYKDNEIGYFSDYILSSEKEAHGNPKSLNESSNFNSFSSRKDKPKYTQLKKLQLQVERSFSVRCSRLTWENTSTVLFFFNEQTECLIKSSREAGKKHSKEKGSLLASISHKLYTPLNIILSSLDNIKIKLEQKDKILRKQVKVCTKSANFLFYSIRNVVDVSQPRTNLLDADVKYYKIGCILEEVVDLMKYFAKMKNVKLEAYFQPFKDLKLLCDAENLKRVLLNLLENSFKYTSAGGRVKILLNLKIFEQNTSPTLKMMVSNSKKEVHLSTFFLQFAVQDDGCGIPENQQRDLVKSFSSFNLNQPQGVCTGLSLTQKLIKSMLAKENYIHGALKLISHPQIKGSQFSFMLPLETLSDTDSLLLLNTISCPRLSSVKGSRIGPLEQTLDENQSESKMISDNIIKEEKLVNQTRVLIVDDDICNQIVLKSYLSKLGINKFETADNGEQAVEKVKKASSTFQPFDLVLMDINMPIKDGYQASKEIGLLASKGEIQETIIIAITANVASNNWNDCREAGMKAFLTKPVNKKLFRETLESFLRKKFD